MNSTTNERGGGCAAPTPVRRPVSVATNDYGGAVVICDDGTAWMLTGKSAWRSLPPIPGAHLRTWSVIQSGGVPELLPPVQAYSARQAVSLAAGVDVTDVHRRDEAPDYGVSSSVPKGLQVGPLDSGEIERLEPILYFAIGPAGVSS